MITILEREAQSDETGKHEWCTEPNRSQTGLWLKLTTVRVDELPSNNIMQPVTNNLAQDSGNNRGKIEKSDLLGAEVVKRSEENR